ncbi:MAG TPA: ATP-dependent helicase [Pirellulaceae bacterium]|nr:ATP-dependent helicase [Pirellulaceae bacterium]HMO93584.1 ATP-dependent helicase [Pirellulaceae bacterium]HMP71553.1 ATP-dependent helicase [Pirellulaceae bacterium]
MTDPKSLNSSDRLDDIEHHFRVTAGPGSGKTHWLIGHVRQVAQESQRITPCSRIGVISYTNIAVREIQRRLGAAADVTEVSTIHSFLFGNVVRPYLHLLKDSSGSDIAAHNLVDTHSEHFIAHDILDGWLDFYGRRQVLMQPNNLQLLKVRLRGISVRIDGHGLPFHAPCKTEARDKHILGLLTPERLLEYKSQYWKRGHIDHEDVLYFAYRLLAEFSALRKFLSAKFPYLYIDEFQDTLPVQAAVVRSLADAGTVVGVIGDPEQAIYSFLDASPTHFNGFQLSGFRAYSIDGNRRSTQSIVSFLNSLRTDGLEQQPIETENGTPPTVYFGSLADALSHARANTRFASSMLVLARSHKNVLKARRPDSATDAATWENVEKTDSDRFRLLYAIASATDLALRGLFDLAVQRLVQGISSKKRFRPPLKYDGNVTIEKRRAVSLSFLEYAISNHEAMLQKSTLEVYRCLTDVVGTCLDGLSLTKAIRGKFCDQMKSSAYSDLVHGIKTTDETRLVRTIHQAKGGEADAVFVVLDNGEAEHILDPKAGDEEHRITYVALSRAKSELFIYCPERSQQERFKSLGLKIVELKLAPKSIQPSLRGKTKKPS